MRPLNRREFIRRSAGLAGISALAPQAIIGKSFDAQAASFKIGFQSWVVREPLNKDFAGTLKKMANQGYESIEMCSPVGYSKAGFAPLESMPVKEMKRIMKGEGISCESSHFTFRELENDIDASIAFAQELGLKQMVVSSTGLRDDASLYDWKKAAAVMNRWGMLTKKQGLPFAFHNHNLEFEKREGQIIYDVLLDELDPDLVKMQFQVWVVIAGFNAADYFRKHPGRFISAHLSDWSGNADERTNLGEGTVDWPDFFRAAKKGGLKNIYVEMAPEYLPGSAKYLGEIL